MSVIKAEESFKVEELLDCYKCETCEKCVKDEEGEEVKKGKKKEKDAILKAFNFMFLIIMTSVYFVSYLTIWVMIST